MMRLSAAHLGTHNKKFTAGVSFPTMRIECDEKAQPAGAYICVYSRANWKCSKSLMKMAAAIVSSEIHSL